MTEPRYGAAIVGAAAIYASAFTGASVHSGQITAGSPFARRMDGSGAPWRAATA